MKKIVAGLFLCIASVLLIAGSGLASNTASSAQDISDIANTENWTDPDFNTTTGSSIINGITISWAPSAAPDTYDFYIGGVFLTTFDSTLGAVEEWRIVELIAQALFSSDSSLSVPTSSAAQTSSIVFNQLVMPNVLTKADKKKAAAQKSMKVPRLLGGQLRYENVESAKTDGEVVGFNIGLAQDFDNITFGAILPYDSINYDNLFKADRFGAVFYGTYILELGPQVSSGLTGNLNYMYTDLDYESGGGAHIGTIGGGLSASVSLDKDHYSTSVAVSCQYNEDDTDVPNDHQYLIKLGGNAGYRIGENHAVTVFGVWNKDVTDYTYAIKDDDYFDLGTEVTANLSEAWGLTVGYKKIVGLDAFESDEGYLGSILRF